MSNRHPLSIQHAIPGRMRLGVEPLRGRDAEAERLAEAVRALPGIRGARANASAASLVVEFDPRMTQDDLLGRRGGPTPHWIVFLMYGLDSFAVLNQAAIRRFLEPPPAAAPGG